MMNQLKRRQPAASAKERSDEPAGTRIEKLAGEEEERITIQEARRRRKSAGAQSVDDISSDVIIQQEDSADEKRCARYGMSCDDISLDVITFSSWLSADEAKRKRRCDVGEKRRRRGDPVASYSAFSICYLELAIAKRCRLHKLIQRFALATKIQQEDFAFCFSSRSYSGSSRNAKIPRRNVLSIQSQEDSGEAFGQPDASNSSIQSRAYLYQLLLYIQSRATVSSRKKSRRKESKK
ncbi:TMV resistance protein N-like [Dorcoceras hygrometricum]|uniref:TMV resistance protein N-like n=1 Tax=Dorcoceras hygrometricum TaxID=472368 RepID=A0A2Z7AX12_9LAMI|nr:TMV resistance protein N-like [Dorcoceras hygrometricum]